MLFGKDLIVMQRPNNPNLMILELAVNALGSLADDMLLDGRPAIVEDVRNADEVVKNAI